MSFQGTAWLLLEAKTTFYSPRYSQESLSVRRQVFPFWTRPQTILQLGETEYLVLHSSPQDAAKRSGDPKETKKLLQLTVRPLDDVRRAQMYQTAARAQVLELFVDVEHTRDRLLRCLRGDESEKAAEPGKKLLDDAFVALERAQKSRDRETALKLYKTAERGFYEAEKVVVDDRSRDLLRVRRGDLQKTIRGLELEQEKKGLLVVEVEAAEMGISARLEELRRFAVEEQEDRTTLAARLAALKNEKAGPAPPVDDLAERLRRLRRDKPAETVGAVDAKSAVDRVIEQVTDAIALGIEDDEIDAEEELDSDTMNSSRSSSSEDSKSSEESDARSSVKK